MNLLLLVSILILSITNIDSARILSVIPTSTKSHFASAKSIIKELLLQGHRVVSISPHDVEGQGSNYTWVPIEINSLEDALPNLTEWLAETKTFFGNQIRLWQIMNKYSEYVMKQPKLKKFIEEDNSKFDLIFAEDFLCEAFLVFAYKYNAPLVMISTFGSAHYINQYMGNAYELSYVPHEFIDLYGELNFFDRAKNMFCTLFDLVFKRYYSLNFQKELARRTFSHLPDAPDVEEIRANVSVMFLNSHFSMSVVRPFLPNIVEIGGVHIEEVKPLDQNIKTIMDQSSKGVILFSFGSFLDLSVQSPENIQKFLGALGRLEQTVLIRWNSDKEMPITSNNVFGLKWLQQNEILAHPNTKAFITHGGLLGSQEAIYHGVPTLCIPFYGDQPLNCKKAVLTGYGLSLDINNIDEDVLYKTIQELLTNPQYSKKAKKLSSRFKDRPSAARDTAVYWIEYVIRHRGADFIRSPKRNLYWFQVLFLDVLVVAVLCLILVFKIIMMICKLVFKKHVKVKKN